MKPHTVVSEHPLSDSVAHATTAKDLTAIGADVERNLKLWGAIEAFRNGQLPNNQQLDKIVRRLARRCKIKDPNVSSETLDACAALRGLLETTRVALREKNADELIQQTAFMIYRESQVGTDGAHRAVARAEAEAVRRAEPPTEPVTVDSDGESLATVETSPSEAAEIEDSVDVAAADQATRDGQLVSAARNIRRLVTIFFTSPELRAAINDTLLVLQEMIKDKQKEKSQGKSKEGQEADGKGKTGTTGQSRDTQPDASETTEALPTKAEENTVDAPTTDPAPDASSAGEEVTTSFDYLKGLFDDAVAAVNGDTPANGAAHTTGSTPQPPGAYWDDADDPDSEYTDAEEDPQHHEAAEELTGFLSDPRLVECGEKLKLAIVSLQEQEGYTSAMTWLLDTFEAYETAMLVRPQEPRPHNRTPIERIMGNIATLLERFARGRSLGPVQSAIRKIYAQGNADPAFAALWNDIDHFLRECLVEPGYIASAKCSADADALWERMKTRLSDEVSAAQWRLLSSTMTDWLGLENVPEGSQSDDPPPWFPDDPVSRAYADGWSALNKALFLDSRGKVVFKRRVWEDISRLTFPTLKGMGFIPLPRVEFMSPNVELVMENIFISVANLLPSMVTIKLNETAKWSPFEQLRPACDAARRQRVHVRVEQIQADVRGVLAVVNLKKFGIKDSGVVDILLSRKGLSIELDLDIDTLPDAPEMLIAHNISVTVDELKVNVLEADSGYKWLYPAVLKLALPLLKARMKMRMTQRLKEAVERASAEMVEIRRRVNAGSPEGTPAVRLGEVVVSEHDGASRILRIVLQRLKEIKHEADVRKALPRKKLWRLSTRLEDSLFPDVTQNGEKSIEYRRHRAETRARLASMGSGAAVRRPRMVTDTGLRAAETKAWRSSVFSFQ